MSGAGWHHAARDDQWVGPHRVDLRVEGGRVAEARFTVTKELIDPPTEVVRAAEALFGLPIDAGRPDIEGRITAAIEGHGTAFRHADRRLTTLVQAALVEPNEPDGWRFVDAGPEITRVPRLDEYTTTGLEPDLTAWEDHTWVLHACYRNPELAQFGTADELHRALLAEGLVEPDMVGDVALDDLCQATGIVLGWSPVPGPAWHRVRWAEIADLTAPHRYPPSHQWTGAHQDADFEGLNEGSMDEATWTALSEVLARFLPGGLDGEVIALHCGMISYQLGAAGFEPVVRRGPLRSVDARVRPPFDSQFLPNDIWAPDLSWITWTDYDLSGTVVAGPTELVDAVRAHPDLETCQWLRAE